MRVVLGVVSVALFLTMGACVEEAVQGTEAANACSGIICPPGTTRDQTASASSSCEGGGSVSVDLVGQDGSVTGQCFGSGECAIVCHPPAPCCGGEKWTTISYECETPCAGSCDCAGRCGPIAGTDCQVDCGDCTGTDLCSPEGYCESTCGEGETQCNGLCCDIGETCHENLCCDPIQNCEGKQCGDDGCGGLCEDQDSIEGCDVDADEVCVAGTCTASGCQDIPSQCASEGGKEFINGCKEGEWQKLEDCSSEDGTPYCDTVAGAPTCVLCSEDGHCGNPANYTCEDNACVCTPNCGENTCGDDGCGGSCGACEGSTPNCLEKDGLSSCYACVNDSDCGDPIFWSCSEGGCSCAPDCGGETCGADGCDGWCGTCDGDGGCEAVGQKTCSTGTGLQETLTCGLVDGELVWQTSSSCSGDAPNCQNGACVCTSDADCQAPGEQCVEGSCTYIAGCDNGVLDVGEFCPGSIVLVQSFSTPYDIELADINLDGNVDIIVAYKGGAGGSGFTILYGSGNGAFGLAQDVTLLAGDAWEFKVVSIADEAPDLVVRTVFEASQVYLDFYRGNGTGSFDSVKSFNAANHYAGFGLGPLDAGAERDLVFQEVAAGVGAVDLSVAFGTDSPDALGSSEILVPGALPAPTQSLRDVEIVDMDGAGTGEVLMTTFGTGEPDRVVIGTDYTSKPGGFMESKLKLDDYSVPTITKATPDPAASNFLAFPFYGLDDIETGDFDGNGKMDFVVSAGGGVAVWKASGVTYIPFFTHDLEVASKSGAGDMGTDKVCTADLNGDSVTDLLVPVRTIATDTSAGYGLAILSDPVANSMVAQGDKLLDLGMDLLDVDAADLNGDGAMDIVLLTQTGLIYHSIQQP